jgi:hypothetical protein
MKKKILLQSLIEKSKRKKKKYILRVTRKKHSKF